MQVAYNNRIQTSTHRKDDYRLLKYNLKISIAPLFYKAALTVFLVRP